MRSLKQKIPSTKGALASVISYSEKPADKLAILCPGFLDSKDYKQLVGLSETLNTLGYDVVRFDPTGTWESKGDISDYNISQYLEDVKTVLEYMLKQTNYKKILLGGHSLGGQISILYAARDPRISIVLGIMASSGPIDGRRREEWEKSGLSLNQRDLPEDKGKKKEFRVPFQYVLDRDRYNPDEEIKKIQVPIILISGEKDDVVPPEVGKEFFANANEPKSLVVIPLIGHDYRHNNNEIKLVDKYIVEELNKYQ